MSELLDVALLAATLRVMTPILLAALGELINERTGVLNLGVEGTMMLGAFIGFLTVYATGSLALGLLAVLVAGALVGALMALLTVVLGLNQHASGLGITLLCTGLSLFGYRVAFGNRSVPPKIPMFSRLELSESFGPLRVLLEQYWLTYFALALIPLVWWLLFHTRIGLRLRAVGENPEAADVAGVPVYRLRASALIVGSMLMALGGSFLTLAQLGSFTPGIVAGRGWVAIALVIVSGWVPGRLLAGAVLFGFVQALQLRIQATGIGIPYQFLLALPYLVTIAVLAVVGRRVGYPAALLKPYRREG